MQFLCQATAELDRVSCLCALFLALFLCGGIAKAQPSFDCALAKTPVEKAICGNKLLADMDTEMARAFAQEKAQLEQPYLETFLKEQKAWLRARSQNCPQKEESDLSHCLIDLYRNRTGHLYALIALKGGWYESLELDNVLDVVFIKDPSEALSLFKNNSSDDFQCEIVVNVGVQLIRSANYGAICTFSHGGRAVVCADDMVGNYHREPIGQRSLSTRELVQFVAAHCAGG